MEEKRRPKFARFRRNKEKIQIVRILKVSSSEQVAKNIQKVSGFSYFPTFIYSMQPNLAKLYSTISSSFFVQPFFLLLWIFFFFSLPLYTSFGGSLFRSSSTTTTNRAVTYYFFYLLSHRACFPACLLSCGAPIITDHILFFFPLFCFSFCGFSFSSLYSLHLFSGSLFSLLGTEQPIFMGAKFRIFRCKINDLLKNVRQNFTTFPAKESPDFCKSLKQVARKHMRMFIFISFYIF